MAGEFVNATTLDTVRIECVGEARAVTGPGRMWVDTRDAYKALLTAFSREQIESLMRDAGRAINANNGECPLVEAVLCRVTALCVSLLRAAPEPGK